MFKNRHTIISYNVDEAAKLPDSCQLVFRFIFQELKLPRNSKQNYFHEKWLLLAMSGDILPKKEAFFKDMNKLKKKLFTDMTLL